MLCLHFALHNLRHFSHLCPGVFRYSVNVLSFSSSTSFRFSTLPTSKLAGREKKSWKSSATLISEALFQGGRHIRNRCWLETNLRQDLFCLRIDYCIVNACVKGGDLVFSTIYFLASVDFLQYLFLKVNFEFWFQFQWPCLVTIDLLKK